MDDDTSGKVDDAPFKEQSVRMPRHMRQWTIYEDKEENHEEQIGREADTLRKRTGYQGWRDNSELHLEQSV